jgi:hypothetical protein
MRFRLNVIFLLITTILLSGLEISYAATGWNLLSETAYSNVIDKPTDAAKPFPVVVGDFIGDSNDDIAIASLGSVYIFVGDGTTISATHSLRIGPVDFSALAKMSDIGGDGKDELIIGVPSADSTYIFRSEELSGALMTDSDASVVISEAAPNGIIGTNVGSAGDIDGDNLPDILISSGLNESYADLFLGSSIVSAINTALSGSGLPATIDSLSADARYSEPPGVKAGYTHFLGSAGDLNGDGYDEVLITHIYDAAGSAYIYLGGATIDTTVDLKIQGKLYGETETRFGFAVASSFDIDNDGYDDLMIGAPDAGPHGAGVSYLYFGHATDIVELNGSAPLFVEYFSEGTSSSNGFGLTMDSFNANGDSYDDVMIGAPFAKDGGAGRAYYISGNARASLSGFFDNIIVGSFITVPPAIPTGTPSYGGENLAYILKTGSANDLYLFSYNAELIKHYAITTIPPNVIGGTITSDRRLASAVNGGSDIYYVREDVIVPVGVTLTIDPGVTISFNSTKFTASGFSEQHLEFNIFGSLIAEGTATNRITFNMNRDPSDTSPGGWLGINLEDTSTSSIKYADIRYGLNGIWVDRASLTLEDSTITNNGGTFIPRSDCDDSFSCDPSVGNGVFIKSGVLTPLIGCTMSDNEGTGLIIEPPDSADVDPANVLDSIELCFFERNGGEGVAINDGELVIDTIDGNEFNDNEGSGLAGIAGTSITNNTVTDNKGDGISADRSTITGNYLARNDTGLSTSECLISNNEIIGHVALGASISGGSFTDNFVGVTRAGVWDPATTANDSGVDVSGRTEVSRNIISGNTLDGVTWDSNSPDSESPGILWRNEIQNNGDSGVVLVDASPAIAGNNITGNGRRGSTHEMNGIKMDIASKPEITQNNIINNNDMALRLTSTAPGNINETFTLTTSGNWWGTTNTTAIYNIIWDSGDDIALPVTVIISPASSSVDTTLVPKPETAGGAQQSIISCFVATASYDDMEVNNNIEKSGMINSLFEILDNMLFDK